MSCRVLVAEDHVVVRQGLKALLERENFEVVGEASDGREATRLACELLPDVAILDLVMPRLNGIDATRAIRGKCPEVRTIALTMHTEDQYVLAALQAGFRGYVLKSQAASHLVRAIQEVCRGEIYLSPAVSKVVVDAYLGRKALPEDPLTQREREVLQLVAEGKTSAETAKEMHISIKTVETHRRNIAQKLGLHGTAELTKYAIREGLTSLDG